MNLMKLTKTQLIEKINELKEIVTTKSDAVKELQIKLQDEISKNKSLTKSESDLSVEVQKQHYTIIQLKDKLSLYDFRIEDYEHKCKKIIYLNSELDKFKIIAGVSIIAFVIALTFACL